MQTLPCAINAISSHFVDPQRWHLNFVAPVRAWLIPSYGVEKECISKSMTLCLFTCKDPVLRENAMSMILFHLVTPNGQPLNPSCLHMVQSLKKHMFACNLVVLFFPVLG